ncbi:prepilin peptidase [Sediminibacillus albus]|uniref:Leader peptidase (Prepilin peptidase) / N-methyltransferase n=1 Tax=Sediminibacillus albus TaxID=407036 RepID=A0A1G9BNI2_9BACI|nr:A24 family peptidase [Sediminibacillus albus]SDK40963.1 leader peptidase (prepilin peptidase) / N-methyltransferase [Sediminibacillus albus]
MQLFYLCYFFVLGLILGSFYSVVGLRVPKQELFKSRRSYCPNCRHSLAWYELVPVFSFLVQAGKCRCCRRSISVMYPLAELITGLLFAFSYYYIGMQGELVAALLLVSLLVIILVSDLRYMEIPNRVLLFFLPLFLVVRLFVPLDPWWSPFFGFVLGIILLAAIIIFSRGGMGGGDMKLFGVIGLVLGWKQLLLAFFFSTVYGSVISMVLLSLKVIDRKEPVPFGPYIVLGTLTTYFFGDKIINWYFTLFF